MMTNFLKLKLSLMILIIIGCQNNNKSSLDSKEEISCHSTVETLKGQDYLDRKFLQAIDNISIDSQKAKDHKEMVRIKGGTYRMGGDKIAGFENMPSTALAQPDEFPKHEVQVSDFWMDEHEVTVGEYLEFVKATNYVTVAEQDVDWEVLKKQLPQGTPKPNDEQLKAGALVFSLVSKDVPNNNLENWWTYTIGANWKNPDGKNPKIESILNMPVTQISWYDAMAYAKWAGKRLPTEAEYEYALRGGKPDNMYPWGNEPLSNQKLRGNFLQGEFPYTNFGKDGYLYAAPVKSFAPNAYGLYDLAGNVWEWTSDWYSAIYYKELADKNQIAINPQGPDKSFEVYDANAINKVVRGGSFLCSDNWCSGYRNSRRMRLSPDSGMQHLGFRCVRDAN